MTRWQIAVAAANGAAYLIWTSTGNLGLSIFVWWQALVASLQAQAGQTPIQIDQNEPEGGYSAGCYKMHNLCIAHASEWGIQTSDVPSVNMNVDPETWN